MDLLIAAPNDIDWKKVPSEEASRSKETETERAMMTLVGVENDINYVSSQRQRK